jgi:hypothetical protein
VILTPALATQCQLLPVNTRHIYAALNLAAARSDSERPSSGSGLAPLGPTLDVLRVASWWSQAIVHALAYVTFALILVHGLMAGSATP